MIGRREEKKRLFSYPSSLWPEENNEGAKVLKVLYAKIWLQVMGSYKRVRGRQC